MKYIVLAILGIILISSCKDESNCLKSTGKIIKENRIKNNFSTIFVYDNVDLIFTADTVQKIEVEAGENIIDNIITEVDNYSLTIKNENKCNWLRSYNKKIKVYVSQPGLLEIYNYSTGSISNNFEQVFDSLIIHNYGNGELNMRIKCNKLKMDTNFLGDVILSGESTVVKGHFFRLARVNTTNLKCQDMDILSEAEGDIFVRAENSLTATIKSKGNIYYSGNPSVKNLQDLGEGNFVEQ